MCLLVVNTTLAANSIEISDLQHQNAARTEQVQQLQQLVAVERSAAMIEKEARRLGMRPDPALIFVDLRTKSIEGPPGIARRSRGSLPDRVGTVGALTKAAGRSGR
jgi:hypothetical protein